MGPTDPYADYVGRWSDVCRAAGGTVVGQATIRLLGPPGNLPIYGIVRFQGSPAEAVAEADTWKAKGAPFSFTTDDEGVAGALAGMIPMNRFGFLSAAVTDLGQPAHEVRWTDDVAQVMAVQAECHGIPPSAVGPALVAMQKLHQDGKEHYVLVKVDDRPVGCASLYVGQGNAGMYSASVLPTYRRQGIGRSMAQALMAKATELGLTTAVATTTPDGAVLSAALGGQVAGEIQQFAWFPDPSEAP